MSTSKIILIGDFTGDPDEGMKKASQNILSCLSKNHSEEAEIRGMSLKQLVLSPWSVSGSVLHFLHGPSSRLLWCCLFLGYLFRPKLIVLNFIHPELGPWGLRALKMMPKCIVCCSDQQYYATLEQNSRIEVEKGPIAGVDLSLYQPVSEEKRTALREKWKLGSGEGKPMALHVGHLKEGRNLRALIPLTESFDVVVVVSRTTEMNDELRRVLTEAGVQIIDWFIDAVHEVYQISDLYVFPVRPETQEFAINFPLSVVEALGCGVPVISTRFGQLETFLAEDPNLRFVDEINLQSSLEVLEESRESDPRTSDLSAFEWSGISERFWKIYQAKTDG